MNVLYFFSGGLTAGLRHHWSQILVWFVGFYGVSTFVGNLTPNPFLCK